MVYLLFLAFLFYGESKAYSLEPLQNDNNPSNMSLKIEPFKSLVANLISDPALFVSEISNLVPDELRKIIALLQNLKSTSLSRKKHLVDTLVILEGEVVEAFNSVTEADKAVTDAGKVLTTAQGIYNTKLVERNVAQKEHDDEVDSLNEEQSVLSNAIEMLENLNGKHYLNGNLVFNEDNWIFKGDVTLNNDVVTGRSGSAETKATFSRPLEVSFTSRAMKNPECVYFHVFPQNDVRQSGYTMGYGWWGNKLGYGVDENVVDRSSAKDNGDILQNHVYKMQLLSSGIINYYQDDELYHTIDDSKYQSGKIGFGHGCVQFEVSAVSIKEL